MWRQTRVDKPERRMIEIKPSDPSDILKWIDTSVMAADCLTKLMKESYLLRIIEANWDYSQKERAKSAKIRKSELRREAKQRAEESEQDISHERLCSTTPPT